MSSGYLELRENQLTRLRFVVPSHRVVYGRDQEEADGHEVVAVVVRVVRQPLAETHGDVVRRSESHEHEEAA